MFYMNEKQMLWLHNGEIKKDVFMISVCVNDGTVTLKRAGKDKEIPCVVNFYNQYIGGVDKSDQMLTSYEIERKIVKK